MKALILSVALVLCAGVAQATDFQAFANVCDHGVQDVQVVRVQNHNNNVQVVRVQNVHQQRQQVVLVQNVRQRQRQQVVVVQNVRQRRNNVVLVQDAGLIGVNNANQFGLFNINVNR